MGRRDGRENPETPHLHAWLRHAEGALGQLRQGARMDADLPLHDHLSQLSVLRQLEHLRTYPILRQRLDAGRLRVHAWWFDIAHVEVLAYDDRTRRFVLIDDAEARRLLARLEQQTGGADQRGATQPP